MVLGLSDFQDPNANNKMDMMATAIKHRINKSMRTSQLNDKHTTQETRENANRDAPGRAKTAQLFWLFMSSSLGSAPTIKKKVPTKILADTREKKKKKISRGD